MEMFAVATKAKEGIEKREEMAKTFVQEFGMNIVIDFQYLGTTYAKAIPTKDGKFNHKEIAPLENEKEPEYHWFCRGCSEDFQTKREDTDVCTICGSSDIQED